MRSSNTRRRALSRLAIIIMMALVVVFLVSVAPVGGAAKPKVCKDKCGKKIKETDGSYDVTNCIRQCVIKGKIKWKITTKSYDYGHYEQWCDDYDWCTNSKCIKVGEPYDKLEGTPDGEPGAWKKCTGTDVDYVKLLPDEEPENCDNLNT